MSNARNIGKTTGTNTGDQTSLPGGVTGSVLYQSGVGVTAMTAAGTTGQVLTTLTTGANPTWQAPTGGGVTSVTGTSPISSSGGTTPAISISAATTSVAGSMSSADKTKLDAITGTNTGDQTLPTTLPASDVYSWAKAATKPTYTYTEVGAQIAGTYATGSGSASGTNTGDETGTTIKSALGITTLSGSNTGDQTTITGNAGTATSLTGGVTGSVPYQSNTNVTAMTAAGTTGQVLTTLTTGAAPTWQTPSGGGGGDGVISTTLNILSTSKVLPVDSRSMQYGILTISVGGSLTIPVTARFKIQNF